MCGKTRIDRCRKNEVRRKVGVREEMRDRLDQKVLKWFRFGEMDRVIGKAVY